MHRDLPAITRLFADLKNLRGRHVPGGQALYRAGDVADALFLVRAGAFAVQRAEPMGPKLVGVVRTGEIIGESAMFAGTPRSATVVALRDSDVIVLPAADFFEAARRMPEAMVEVARLLIARARTAGAQGAPPKLFALASLTSRVSARPWAAKLASEMRTLGHSVALLDSAAENRSPDWWSAVEEEHDYVLCSAECLEEKWSATCRRQVDLMMLIGHGGETPPPDCRLCASEPLQASGLVDLLLFHDGSRPTGSAAWMDTVRPGRLHHIVDGEGCARLARVLTGRAVGLVLSGGGARAFAHVGAVEVLREAGVPVDSVCGTSMGAIVASGVALGWDAEELNRRMRDAFVKTSPLDDIALPFVALTRGGKVDRRLEEHFGTVDIADLALPFFCVSADLGSGNAVTHRRGPLATALRATIALPGILPPVTIGNQVLVDGGVLRNLPADLMRTGHDGTIVAIDVSHSTGLLPADVDRPRPLGSWFWSGSWRRGPPIMSILMRSATLASGPDLVASRAAADLYIMPEVGGIEIRNWRAYDRAVRAGREAMITALAGLDSTVPMLRRRSLEAAATSPL